MSWPSINTGMYQNLMGGLSLGGLSNVNTSATGNIGAMPTFDATNYYQNPTGSLLSMNSPVDSFTSTGFPFSQGASSDPFAGINFSPATQSAITTPSTGIDLNSLTGNVATQSAISNPYLSGINLNDLTQTATTQNNTANPFMGINLNGTGASVTTPTSTLSAATLTKDPYSAQPSDTKALIANINTQMQGVLNGLPQLVASIQSNPANYTNYSGGTGGTGSTGTNMSGPDVAAGDTNEAIKFFESQGWSHAQAAGIVANLKAESGLKTSAVGDGGSAYGIAQWHPDRQANFAKFAKAAGLSNTDIHKASFKEQLGFVNWELTQGPEKSAGDKLKGTTSAGDAAAAFCRYYERPADPSGQSASRAQIANQIA